VDTDSDAPETADLNRTILDLALTIAEGHRGTVTLLHAWSLYGEELLRPRMGGPTCDAALEAIRRTAVDNATALVAPFGDRGAPVRIECLKGEPHVVIQGFVAANNVNLVVMGTVGRGGIAGLLMANTAERVLRALRGSVLAVKPPGFVTPVEPAEAQESRVV
jgi:nucleotide-binding universal stress UspA family protein